MAPPRPLGLKPRGRRAERCHVLCRTLAIPFSSFVKVFRGMQKLKVGRLGPMREERTEMALGLANVTTV